MSAVGVLPAPPSVKLPMHTTGMPTSQPCRRIRHAATAPYSAATGASDAEANPGSRHQNDGASMRLPIFQAKLHQVGIDRRQGAIERPAERLDGLERRRGDRVAQARIGEQGADTRGELFGIVDLLGATGGIERRI